MRDVKEIVLHGNLASRSFDDNNELLSKEYIQRTWKNNYYEKIENEDELGLRPPQFGALSAIRAHWTLSAAPATVVLPTGVGKTETMMATILSEQITTTLIIVPSQLLRKQIYEKAKNFGILSELGIMGNFAEKPNTICLQKGIQNVEDGDELFKEANIIVSTVNLINSLPQVLKNRLTSSIDVLMVDEAHHLGAKGWAQLKLLFENKKILQFTATPFRNDGKQIGGEIIYNYSLGLAQKADYFKPIEFYPLEEFNEMEGDKKIAEKAVELLQNDLGNNLNHVLLARANNKKRAKELYDNIYSSYKIHNPVLIYSGLKASDYKERLGKLKSGESRIVVGVDMFGEGIDFPSLKVAAIHDKYKSLPITLQFIGRFTRYTEEVGTAKLVTNIANDDLRDIINDLYQKDVNWNSMLKDVSDSRIEMELNHKHLVNNFANIEHSDIDLAQLKLRISTRIFTFNQYIYNESGWLNVLDPEVTYSYYNSQDNIWLFIEKVKKEVDWSNQENVYQYDWDVFVIYLSEDKKFIYLNDTNENKGNRLIKALFGSTEKVGGDRIYRVLDGINRLMISTMGLKRPSGGHVSFRMFAGTDVKQGISQAVREGTIKSNLFGYGFKQGDKVSIGCSYKGKVWMRWVESLDFWRKWCDEIGEKISDSSIDTSKVLENTLVVEPITEFPVGIPYKVELEEEIVLSSLDTKSLKFQTGNVDIPLYCLELREPRRESHKILFDVVLDRRIVTFSLEISNGEFKVNQENEEKLIINFKNGSETLSDYFKQYPPNVSFIDPEGRVHEVEGNLIIYSSRNTIIDFPEERIQSLDWGSMGVDVKVESQRQEKKPNSIQYATIHNIVPQGSDIIFDDDGSGEIADVIAIESFENSREIKIHLYHCKYSKEDKPGSRVGDLYEVCGQAEKSIVWNSSPINIFDRIFKREQLRMKSSEVSRFEKGDLNILKTIKNQFRSGFSTELYINIVQPGVSKSKISEDMHRILNAMETYLTETYEIKATCYFSE